MATRTTKVRYGQTPAAAEVVGRPDPLTAEQLAALVRDVQGIMSEEGFSLDAAAGVLHARVSPASLESYAAVLVAQERAHAREGAARLASPRGATE